MNSKKDKLWTGIPIEMVKRKLWRFNFGVRDFHFVPGMDFDLMVTGKDQTELVSITTERPDRIPRKCSVVAWVEKSGKITFVVKSKGQLLEFKSPYKVFGQPKNKGRALQNNKLT